MSESTAPLSRLGAAATEAAESLHAFSNAYDPPHGRDDLHVLLQAAWPDVRQRFARLAGPVRPDEEPTP